MREDEENQTKSMREAERRGEVRREMKRPYLERKPQ